MKDLSQIFKLKKIKKVSNKTECILNGESFSKPLNGERGFFGTVFRGLGKDIEAAQRVCKERGIYGYVEKTKAEGVFDFSVQRGGEEAIREILRTIPALKMVTFFAWWDGSCGAYYSHSGYPYITESTNDFLSFLHVPKTQDEPWIFRRRADERIFSEEVDLRGDSVTIAYRFLQFKDWCDINYITDIEGQLYELMGMKPIDLTGKVVAIAETESGWGHRVASEVISRGGTIRKSVSSKTDIMVYFNRDRLVRKAEELNAAGENIIILDKEQIGYYLFGGRDYRW